MTEKKEKEERLRISTTANKKLRLEAEKQGIKLSRAIDVGLEILTRPRINIEQLKTREKEILDIKDQQELQRRTMKIIEDMYSRYRLAVEIYENPIESDSALGKYSDLLHETVGITHQQSSKLMDNIQYGQINLHEILEMDLYKLLEYIKTL